MAKFGQYCSFAKTGGEKSPSIDRRGRPALVGWLCGERSGHQNRVQVRSSPLQENLILPIYKRKDVKNPLEVHGCRVLVKYITSNTRYCMYAMISIPDTLVSAILVWYWHDHDVYRTDPERKIILPRYFNPVGAHPSGYLGEDPCGIPNNLMSYV
jgi:hypothetical protein